MATDKQKTELARLQSAVDSNTEFNPMIHEMVDGVAHAIDCAIPFEIWEYKITVYLPDEE